MWKTINKVMATMTGVWFTIVALSVENISTGQIAFDTAILAAMFGTWWLSESYRRAMK